MSGTDGWEPIKRQSRAKVAIFRHFADDIAGLPAKVYIEGVDIPLLNARYRYPESPHLIAFRHALEDVHAAAVMRGEAIVVICDEVTDQEAHRKRFGQYQLIGTPGYRSTQLSTIEQFMFADSSASPGLQAADSIGVSGGQRSGIRLVVWSK